MTSGIPQAQTYRLRWNTDSSSGLDLSEEFRALRKNSDFFDVSLCCSVNSGGSLSLRAHKVILSSYSGVFREMFRQNSTRQDPFVYLNGISFSNLSNLLDFMYNGEANVSQSNLSTFLALAEELQIKGLQLINKDANSSKKSAAIKRPDNLSSLQRERFQITGKNLPKQYKGYAKDEDESWVPKKKSIKKEFPTKPSEEDDDWMPEKYSSNKDQQADDLFKELNDSLTAVGNDPITIGMSQQNQDYNNNVAAVQNRFEEEDDNDNEPVPEGMIGEMNDFIKNIPSKVQGNKSRTMSRCRICLKEFRRDKIKSHIFRAHPLYLNSTPDDKTNESQEYKEDEFVPMANDDYSSETKVHADSD